MDYAEMVSQIMAAEQGAKVLAEESRARRQQLQAGLEQEISAMRESYLARARQRLKAVFACRGPHLIGGPPLLGGITPGIHQRNSFSAVRLAGMRAAITSRISPCS